MGELSYVPIEVENSSFEIDMMSKDSTIASWLDPRDTKNTPDLFYSSAESNNWAVRADAHTGERYIAIATRAYGTTEYIQQTLPTAIEDVEQISFEFWAAMSESFYTSDSTGILRNYAKPVLIEVYVIDPSGDMHRVFRSEAIDHNDWRMISETVDYCGDISTLRLKACYRSAPNYNGHVLLDDVSFGYWKE